jgi:hypothetical protein
MVHRDCKTEQKAKEGHVLKRVLIMLVCVGFLTGAAHAATVTFSGYFNDQANGALVYADLGAPSFVDDDAIANNVALHSFTVPFAGMVTFDSNGVAAGGADPYFTLFAGSGTTATVAESNYAQAFSTGGDFNLTFNLVAGDYQVAMGVFPNMSSAENWGSGTLGDGFTFGGPGYLGNYYYELAVTTPDGPTPQVPEPCTLLLIVPVLAGLVGIKKKVKK